MKKSKLTLVKEKAKKAKNRNSWLNKYRCECGNITFQYKYSVEKGVVSSCGCGHKRNTAPPDSLLTLIKDRVKIEGGKVYNKYSCKCGNVVIKNGTLVRNGSTKSCGCLKKNFVPPNKKYYTQPEDSKLTLIKEKVKKISKEWLSEYKCVCGKIKLLRKSHVDSGSTKSCGCSSQELRRPYIVTHGLWANNKKLFTVWQTLRRKCYDPRSHNFKNYGGRGIGVCKQWLKSFKTFYEWAIKNGYKQGLQIDRVNNNGNYKPSNCRWTTAKVNSNNRRSNLPKERIREIKILLNFGFGTSTIRQMMGGGAISHIRAIREGRVHSDIKV